MTSPAGGVRSALLLGGLSLAFLAAFVAQRGRSTVLAAERTADTAARIAARRGLAVCDVLALHAMRGGELDERDLDREAARFDVLRRELGSTALAVLAWTGHGALARRLHGRNGTSASRRVRSLPEGVEVARFEELRRRFAARGHPCPDRGR